MSIKDIFVTYIPQKEEGFLTDTWSKTPSNSQRGAANFCHSWNVLLRKSTSHYNNSSLLISHSDENKQNILCSLILSSGWIVNLVNCTLNVALIITLDVPNVIFVHICEHCFIVSIVWWCKGLKEGTGETEAHIFELSVKSDLSGWLLRQRLPCRECGWRPAEEAQLYYNQRRILIQPLLTRIISVVCWV